LNNNKYLFGLSDLAVAAIIIYCIIKILKKIEIYNILNVIRLTYIINIK
jgi:hypothetical protein